MTSKGTKDIRLAEFIRDVDAHPDKDEIIKLMNEQLIDDLDYAYTCSNR